MTTALLYFVTAAAAVMLAHRCVVTMSWRTRAAIILLPLCFVGRALLTGRVYAPIELPFDSQPLAPMRETLHVPPGHNGSLSDVFSLNIPWKSATRSAYAAHEWPLWNPYNFCGDILTAAVQATPYEPVTLLSLLLPPAQSLTFLAAMTFFLAALGMSLLLRDLGCSEIAALTGAAAWAFCAFLVYWLEWVIAPSTLWFPLVILGTRRVIRERSLPAAAILGAAFTMMLLNGHPESALHIVFLGLIWSAGELLLVRGRGLARAAALAAGAGVAALALCAILLLPMLEAMPQTMEYAFRQRGWQRSVRTEVALQHLESSFVPFRFGDPSAGSGAWGDSTPFSYLDSAYCGSVVLALALYGLWRSPRREKWITLPLLAIGFLIGHEFAPFADWLAKLPLFDIAINGRLVFAVAFALSVLAAFGVDAAEGRKLQLLAAIIATVLTIAVALEWKEMLAWRLDRTFILERTLILIIPLIVIAIVPPRFVKEAVLAMLLAQRTAEAAGFYPTNRAEIFYPRIAVLDRLPKVPEPYRVTALGHVFYPNIATLYRVEDVRGYSAMTSLRLRQTYDLWSVEQPVWFNRIDDLTRPFLSALNVRYAMAENGTTVPDGWRKVDAQPGVDLFENMRVLPRAFIPRRVVITDSLDLNAMLEEKDFGNRAWIEIPGQERHEIENTSGRVSIAPLGLSAFHLYCQLDREGWIVVSESAWKGWRATIDGRSTPIQFADHALIGLKVPAGAHQISLRYLPHSFVVGRAITAAMIALLVAGGFLLRRRRRAGH